MNPRPQAFPRRGREVVYRGAIWTIMLIILLSCALADAQQQPVPLRRMRLDMLFSTGLFRSVNRNDAIAAVRVWASMIGRSRGFQIDATVEAVDEVPRIRKRILAGSAGVLALDVVEYFELEDLAAIEPVFCALKAEGSVPPKYLLLVGSNSSISSLEGLRGKTIVIHANTGANLGQVWLDSMLYDRHLDRPEHFFRSVEVVPKASSAILPAFFGKADAAVVDEGSFAVSKEMNPQVGVKLRVLAASPPLAEGLFCICRKQIEFQDEFLASVRDLHLDPQGRQILMVFGFTRLAPVERHTLNQVRELWRKHNLLIRQPEKTALVIPTRQAPSLSGEGGNP